MRGYAQLLLFLLMLLISCDKSKGPDSGFVICAIDRTQEKAEMFWRDESNRPLQSLRNLKSFLNKRNKTLRFAMNGGMFTEHNMPKGLYIENYRILKPLDTLKEKGNFYLEPNGIFYRTVNDTYAVVSTKSFRYRPDIESATQSGPMLIYNGTINPVFHRNSSNMNVRNGVGILKNGNPVFVMSKKKVNFYHFAQVFKSLGCRNALYLDGFVSRAYFPAGNWTQEDGDFGVMIGVVGK